MTREEEIEIEIQSRGLDGLKTLMFRDGANYADSHPRKGLVDIEKVCNFLDGYSFIPTYVIKELRKVMEE